MSEGSGRKACCEDKLGCAQSLLCLRGKKRLDPLVDKRAEDKCLRDTMSVEVEQEEETTKMVKSVGGNQGCVVRRKPGFPKGQSSQPHQVCVENKKDGDPMGSVGCHNKVTVIE